MLPYRSCTGIALTGCWLVKGAKDAKEQLLEGFALYDEEETGKINFANLKRVAQVIIFSISSMILKRAHVKHVKPGSQILGLTCRAGARGVDGG